MENSLKGGISMEFKYTINNDGELDFIIEEIKDETETSSLNDEDKVIAFKIFQNIKIWFYNHLKILIFIYQYIT